MDIFQEMGDSNWESGFHFECQATLDLFRQKVSRTQTDISALEAKQTLLKSLQTKPLPSTLFTDLSRLEKEIRGFESQAEAWEKEGKSQIVFTQEWSKPLNHVPLLLPASAIFKMYVFPFFAVLLPLVAWILPFLIVKYVFRTPMTFATYKEMMINMWLGGRAWAQIDFWGQIRILFQTAWTVFGIFQGVNQPIQQAIHIRSINDTIVSQGKTLKSFIFLTKELFRQYEQATGIPVVCPYLYEIPLEEVRMTYAYVRDHPTDIHWIWRKIAEVECNWKIATTPICFPKFVSGRRPFCKMEKFYDPSIPEATRVCSSLSIKKGSNHCIITGPNKGGKSSTLRAVCLNIWLAQTLGVAFAESMTLTPFDWIRSGLRLVDTPGKESLFERELKFATDILRLAEQDGKGILFYDECFHSTNPPDGEQTAKHFLEAIWEKQNIVSLISTHVFGLLEATPKQVQKLCVPATKEGNQIKYTFQLTPGVCKVSSVEELYAKHGFLRKRRGAAKIKSETGSPKQNRNARSE